MLLPRHLGSLSRSCKVIKAAVKDTWVKLLLNHTLARVLVGKCSTSVELLVEERPTDLDWNYKGLVAADAPALRNVLKSEAVAQVVGLELVENKLGDEGAAAIAAAAAGGGMPRLERLVLDHNQIGDNGVQALASAFASGAFRKLQGLHLDCNEIGDAGLLLSPRHSRRARCRSSRRCALATKTSATKA